MAISKKPANDEMSQAKEMARLVFAHHFGNQKPRRIIHKPSGLTNHVFAVKHSEGDFVIRISLDPSRINDFIKEQWAQTRALKAGVPTPEILEVGNDVIGHPFMIARTVTGHEATYNPNRRDILQAMGRAAALINSIPTSGFGGTFDWSNNLLSRNETWGEFLQNELRWETKLETLEKHKMLRENQSKSLHKIFTAAQKLKPKPALNHGDIRLKNVIVNEAGEINAILDWENCTSNLAPQWELSLALHDLSIDEKQDFLKGYGIREKDFVEIAPLIKAFNAINYAPEIERLAEANDKECLEHYRTRLGGSLDLYSFD
ncbi:MAG: phosphotransferase [Pyrinomonadaceae bacterium]|nr:phosphotransferase [Pyrinomonadaceae bacterium]